MRAPISIEELGNMGKNTNLFQQVSCCCSSVFSFFYSADCLDATVVVVFFLLGPHTSSAPVHTVLRASAGLFNHPLHV